MLFLDRAVAQSACSNALINLSGSAVNMVQPQTGPTGNIDVFRDCASGLDGN